MRVAVYTRQSVADDLQFGSIQAQREAVEAYVRSQCHEGWELVDERFDDHGFSGSNTDRPAFRRLLERVVASEVDLVAVYKIDRLSRSLPDFTQVMRLFEKHGVGFVSITQSFDTSNSMGKLMLNVLMSFAEFEREQIAERTRDKMAATRRRGEWTGGTPMLGYDLVEKRLVVNEPEAEQVREIFDLVCDLGSIGPVVTEVNRRGWRTKLHGKQGGKPFTKPAVRRILTSRIYRGEVEYDGEVFEGDHEAIVDPEIWDAAQRRLQRMPDRGGRRRRVSVLGGLLRCGVCGAGFVHTYTKKRDRQYRYYVCDTAQKQGTKACPGSRISAPEIEAAVVDEIRGIGRDPSVLQATIEAARSAADRELPALERRLAGLRRDRGRLAAEQTRLVDAVASKGSSPAIEKRLQETEVEIASVVADVRAVEAEIHAVKRRVVDQEDLGRALALFEPIWEALTVEEQAQLVGLLVERVEYDGPRGEMTVELRTEAARLLSAGERRSA